MLWSSRRRTTTRCGRPQREAPYVVRASKREGPAARLRACSQLKIGAAGQLLISGDIDELLPLDDHEALAAANPHFNGKVTIDPVAINAREARMAERLTAADEPVSIIVRGVGHDLADDLPKVNYGQVMPQEVKQLIDRKSTAEATD